MKLEAYLQFSIKHKCYLKRAWFFSMFSVTKETETQKSQLYPGKLLAQPYGFEVVLEDGSKEKLETDRKISDPLFSIKDRLTIDQSWISSIKSPTEKIETSIGTLLINLICLDGPFKGKFPYRKGNFIPKDLEKDIALLLQSTPKEGETRKDDLYYVDENIEFQKAVSYIESFSILFSHSVTKRTLLPAPGRREFKKKILPKYEGKLRDPVEFAKFETELIGFDNEYLRPDPSFGKFMSGKALDSRTASFLTQGGQANNFTEEMTVTPIIPALEDGFPLDPEGFTAVSNTIRYGSFARGAETVDGGVVAKALMRSADNWRITEGDCGTKLGSRRIYREDEIDQIVGRYLILGGKPKLIETIADAEPFSSQKIVIRSPQYCRRRGTQTCTVCAGLALSKYPTGLPIPLMEVSGGILNDSLKKMHNSKLKTVDVSLVSVLT